jgi:hypothetical protein
MSKDSDKPGREKALAMGALISDEQAMALPARRRERRARVEAQEVNPEGAEALAAVFAEREEIPLREAEGSERVEHAAGMLPAQRRPDTIEMVPRIEVGPGVESARVKEPVPVGKVLPPPAVPLPVPLAVPEDVSEPLVALPVVGGRRDPTMKIQRPEAPGFPKPVRPEPKPEGPVAVGGRTLKIERPAEQLAERAVESTRAVTAPAQSQAGEVEPAETPPAASPESGTVTPLHKEELPAGMPRKGKALAVAVGALAVLVALGVTFRWLQKGPAETAAASSGAGMQSAGGV